MPASRSNVSADIVRRKPIAILLALLLGVVIFKHRIGDIWTAWTNARLVTRMTDLPMPLFLGDVTSTYQCSGMVCQDVERRAKAVLSPAACKRAVDAAPGLGYRSARQLDSSGFTYRPGLTRNGLYRDRYV